MVGDETALRGGRVMRRCRVGALSVLLASVIVPALPRFLDQLSRARAFLPLSWEQRREALMPGFYANIETLRKQIPERESVALIVTSRPSIDQAVFINYYLFPRRTRIYDRGSYLMDDPVRRPKLIVRPSDARLTTYGELRDEDLRRSHVLGKLEVPPEARSRFIIPIVSSADGPPPVAYTVEGALACDGAAHVTLTLWPGGVVRTLTVSGTRPFYDFVYECFREMRFAAWVRVESDRPLRAAFWLVNRSARTAVPIRIIDGPLRAPANLPVLPQPVILWLLNVSDAPVMAHVATRPALVPPHALLSLPAIGTVSGPVYAFLSEKLPDGQTRFTWPEDLR